MRCYNGCPDKALQSHLDDEAKAHDELKAERMRATWFPMEAKWMMFKGLLPVGGFHISVRRAADYILRIPQPC